MDMVYYVNKINDPIKDGYKLAKKIKLKISTPSLIILISTIFDMDKFKRFMDSFTEILPSDNIIGCSSGGIFQGNNYYNKDSVLVIAFSNRYKSAISYHDMKEEMIANNIINDIYNQLREKYINIDIYEKFLGFIFFDYHINNEYEILNTIGRELGVPIIGGTASDRGKFKNYYLIYKGKVVKDCCIFGLVGGKLDFDIIFGHGYKPTNIYAKVTKAKDNIIYELDNKPALERYIEMISEYTRMPKDIIERNIDYLKKSEVSKIDFTLIHPLGYVDFFGNVIIPYLEKVEGESLIFKNKISEGIFLNLMTTSFKDIINSLYQKLSEYIEKDLLAFINESYFVEVLKNPKFRKYEKNILPYFLEFYKDSRDISKYIIKSNCIGWLSYGEAVSKDILRIYTTLSYVGVIFKNVHTNIAYLLESYGFSEDEISIISNLINEPKTLLEISELTDLDLDTVKEIINKLIKKKIVDYMDISDKYYVDTVNLKKVLKKLDEEIEYEYQKKKSDRKRLLDLL
ncbi:FIST signal transduction protein [Methanocaldococcus indicus]|uniref:FIST signal transduction protein n=1 Tax=Methanocaldococcus indicus TaxID=213231 RepID=UPI003C6D7707